jgi:uncharacterized protein RhaS with RHS repeats
MNGTSKSEASPTTNYEVVWWLSRDPSGIKGGLNLYGYVGNDPMGWIDNKGKDRTLYLNGHMWIEVDTWDQNNTKTGTIILDYGPAEQK